MTEDDEPVLVTTADLAKGFCSILAGMANGDPAARAKFDALGAAKGHDELLTMIAREATSQVNRENGD
jgi:hypothetical protein